MGEFEDWVAQYTQEHGRQPSYDDYQAAQTGAAIRRDYPGVSWQQAYYAAHPNQAPADYWGGGNSAAATPAAATATPPAAVVYRPVKNWADWLDVYGSQPGKVEDMPEALKALQTGEGASSLWDKFVSVAMPDLTDTQRQRLGGRFQSEFSKFRQESGERATQGADPIGWHNWLTTKAPEGLAKDWAYLKPEDRGENPWNFSERQRIQWR